MTRARTALWLLIATASIALGTLTRALEWRAGPAAALTVAVSGLLLAASTALAVRVLIITGRATSFTHTDPEAERSDS